MNIFGNALKFTESGYIEVALRINANKEASASVEIRITDTGIGMCKDFLFQGAFEPFLKRNQHTSGTGVGLNVVRRILEDIGGSIKIRSAPDKGTDVTLQLPLMRYDRPHDPASPQSAIYATLSQLKGRKVIILHSKAPKANGPLDYLRHWNVLKRYIATLARTVQNELHMEVTQTSEWAGHDECDIIVCPEISFASLRTIREKSNGSVPAVLFIVMDMVEVDMVEADTLRCDARVTSAASVVEIMTQP
jgi:hypothetical protein